MKNEELVNAIPKLFLTEEFEEIITSKVSINNKRLSAHDLPPIPKLLSREKDERSTSHKELPPVPRLKHQTQNPKSQKDQNAL